MVTESQFVRLEFYIPSKQSNGEDVDTRCVKIIRDGIIGELCRVAGGCSSAHVDGVWINTDTANIDAETCEVLFAMIDDSHVSHWTVSWIKDVLEDMRISLLQNATLAVLGDRKFLCVA